MHEILKPFLKESTKTATSTSAKLVFHMAVMRWKCSLLNPNEIATLQDWIDVQHASKKKTQTLPWSEEAGEHGDEVFAENTHIQWYVVHTFLSRTSTNLVSYSSIDGLVSTVQLAIEEIERQTGWKAMVILGGLDPRKGKISTHL